MTVLLDVSGLEHRFYASDLANFETWCFLVIHFFDDLRRELIAHRATIDVQTTSNTRKNQERAALSRDALAYWTGLQLRSQKNKRVFWRNKRALSDCNTPRMLYVHDLAAR